VIIGIDVLDAYVTVPGRASGCPLQSNAEKMKTKIHFKGLPRDSKKKRFRNEPNAAVSSEKHGARSCTHRVMHELRQQSQKPSEGFAMKLGLPELSERPMTASSVKSNSATI
jgi:hypothetical protein